MATHDRGSAILHPPLQHRIAYAISVFFIASFQSLSTTYIIQITWHSK
jgi:hypothetical protein